MIYKYSSFYYMYCVASYYVCPMSELVLHSAKVLLHTTSFQATHIGRCSKVISIESTKSIPGYCLTPSQRGFPGFRNGNIIIGRFHSLRTDGFLVGVLRNNRITCSYCFNSCILMEKGCRVNCIVKQRLFNIFLALELFALANFLPVHFALLFPRVSGSSTFNVLFSECCIWRKVNEETFQISERNHSLCLLTAFRLFLFFTNHLLHEFSTLSFSGHPNVV
mmetsp:Transcript_18538/g.22257  ORF Transcript_18538/g.22257 Transcript_18538/m.22257 type:complete len:221 (-) Transcript_18538:1235-1897(-)